MPDLRLRYRDGTTNWLAVRVLHRWPRADLIEPVMSSSGGPKELIRNWVWTLCKDDQTIDEVVMVRASGPPFSIVRRGKTWFDADHKELEAVTSKGG